MAAIKNDALDAEFSTDNDGRIAIRRVNENYAACKDTCKAFKVLLQNEKNMPTWAGGKIFTQPDKDHLNAVIDKLTEVIALLRD